LQLFLVVVRRGFFDLRLDLGYTTSDVGLLANAVDDGGVFLVNAGAFCTAQHVQGYVFQLDAQVFRNHLTAREGGDVFQHGLATIAEARSLDGTNLQTATQLV
jgi:hypothetical protein